MPRDTPPQGGFTLVETLVAIALIALVLGGLEGNAVGTMRRFRDSESEALAARLVQERAESLLAGPCTTSAGSDSSGSVVMTWLATTDGSVVRITQTIRYPTAFGVHTETLQTAGAC